MSFLIRLCRWALPALMLCPALYNNAKAQTSTLPATGAVHAENSAIALTGTIGQAIVGIIAVPGRSASQGFWLPQTTHLSSTPVAVAGEQRLHLACSPNPVQQTATIRLSTPANTLVSLTLHDLLGREVRLLLSSTPIDGPQSLEINTDQLPNGHYTLVLTDGTNRTTLPLHILH